MALRTSNMLIDIILWSWNTEELGDLSYLEGVIAVALGFLMVSLPFFVTMSTYFFPAPVQLTAADHSSVFFSLHVSTE